MPAHDIVVEGFHAKSEDRATFSRETLELDNLVVLAAKFNKSVIEADRFVKTWVVHELGRQKPVGV